MSAITVRQAATALAAAITAAALVGCAGKDSPERIVSVQHVTRARDGCTTVDVRRVTYTSPTGQRSVLVTQPVYDDTYYSC